MQTSVKQYPISWFFWWAISYRQ